MIVFLNFTNAEESLTSRLTSFRFQFLAYAFQELLRATNVDSVLKRARPEPSVECRWKALSPSVLEILTLILRDSFSFIERAAPHSTSYPNQLMTSSNQDRTPNQVNNLISKLETGFPSVLYLEDIAVAQQILPHLVLTQLKLETR